MIPRVKLFEPRGGVNESFKRNYIFLIPKTAKSKKCLFRRFKGESKDEMRFPFYWTREHFDVSSDHYIIAEEVLDNEEITSLIILREYVGSFEPVEGNSRISRYISCKMLMDCDSPEEVKILLGMLLSASCNSHTPYSVLILTLIYSLL